ncbi:hypothetical protein GGQ88_000547 [Novosphingobium hassiacum]|uniref:Uncharacterized protein n=1 Tax=Novosphingobium hassiacum TaxID=173676 RepID=A0A7W6EUL2_9SPHN|nr:hypothetical protein [Novosphingobium hassiacum]MBB3859307.1 hypothetical protein [Novosphingobium hassiacum]
MAPVASSDFPVFKRDLQTAFTVVVIDEVTNMNRLDLFFTEVGRHGQALGRRVWFALEAMFPESVVWEAATP